MEIGKVAAVAGIGYLLLSSSGKRAAGYAPSKVPPAGAAAGAAGNSDASLAAGILGAIGSVFKSATGIVNSTTPQQTQGGNNGPQFSSGGSDFGQAGEFVGDAAYGGAGHDMTESFGSFTDNYEGSGIGAETTTGATMDEVVFSEVSI